MDNLKIRLEVKTNMLNQVILVGNVGNEPDTFFTSEGTQITSFSLAFNSSKKDSAEWIKVVCFNKLATVAEHWLSRGSRVGIQGVLSQQHWKAEDGTPRSSYQVTCQQLEFIKVIKEGKEAEPEKEEVPF